MHIVFLEGCHGIGKSTVARCLANSGYAVLPEVLPLSDAAYPSSSLLFQTRYVLARLHGFLDYQRSLPAELQASHVVFADRGFLSCLAYADPSLLFPLRALVADAVLCMTTAGITGCSVTIQLHPNVVWDRIQARLLDHPERNAYNEGSFLHFTKVMQFYLDTPFSMVVDGTLSTQDQANCLSPLVQQYGKLTSSHAMFVAADSEFILSRVPSGQRLYERPRCNQSTDGDRSLAVTTLSDL